MTSGNNPFPDETPVFVPFPGEENQPRDTWPWLPGEVVQRCGDDEWQIIVLAPELEDADGMFPLVFRDASEIRAGGAR
jgi:hypothetical protein